MINTKRLLLIATALNGLLVEAQVQDCQALCNRVPACRNNLHVQGSYCKTGNTPSVCFGLYYRDIFRRRVCFSPADPTCPQAVPVRCTGATALDGTVDPLPDLPANEAAVSVLVNVNSVLPAESIIVTRSGDANAVTESADGQSLPSLAAVGDELCEFLCLLTPKCAFDPRAHGSYCKTNQNPPVCFGFYFKSIFSVCFEPNDPNCPETRPVPCDIGIQSIEADDDVPLSRE